MSTELVAGESDQKANVKAFRDVFLRELPSLAQEYVDIARAESTTAAMEKVMNTALKVVEGLQVDQAKNPYANLPVINFHIGADAVVTTTVEPPLEVVEDVTPKSPFGASAAKAWDEPLPDDPLALLESPAEPHPQQEILDSLAFGLTALPE